MEKGQKHHYVPEVYLNKFSFDEFGNLYSIKIKPYFKSLKVKKLNKSQVCYKPDNYKFHNIDLRDEKLKHDPYYIENNLFKYENDFINTISDKINNNQTINLLECENLIRVILSIKNRNNHLKKMFQDPKIVKIHIEKEIEKLKLSALKYKVQDSEGYEFLMALIEDKVKEKSSEEPFLSDLFNDQLLKIEERKNNNHEWLIKEMSKSQFKVFCTTDSKPFLTSDNPGYSIHEGGIIGNLFLGSAQAFAFPISKTRLFFITPGDRDGNEFIIKKIKYIEAPEKLIKLSNKSTIINAEERIFSNSKRYLDDLIDMYNFEINQYTNDEQEP